MASLQHYLEYSMPKRILPSSIKKKTPQIIQVKINQFKLNRLHLSKYNEKKKIQFTTLKELSKCLQTCLFIHNLALHRGKLTHTPPLTFFLKA